MDLAGPKKKCLLSPGSSGGEFFFPPFWFLEAAHIPLHVASPQLTYL